jgi:predicted dehydrogenase
MRLGVPIGSALVVTEAAMPVLNVHLISRFDYDAEDIGEGGLYMVGLHLIDFFNQVVAGSQSFTGSDYWYNSDAGQVGPKDLVCYMLTSSGRSIVARHSSDQLGAAGSTVWSLTSQAMISEIYMDATTGDASRPRLLANLIIHELMHNKLDAHPSRAVLTNIHSIANGRVSTGGSISSSSTPSAADVAAMRRGINLAMPQHTGDFRPWSF